MGATPLYLANILAQANAYSRASAMLRLSGTVLTLSITIRAKTNILNVNEQHDF